MKFIVLIRHSKTVFYRILNRGWLPWLGATTENSSFELNRSLLSRLSVYMLEPLNAVELAEILQRALAHENLEAMDEGAQLSVINASGGDARRLISPLIGV